MMTKAWTISLVAALALGGCADSTKAGDDTGGGDDTMEPPPQPEPQVDATGSYRIHSTFDIATNMPGNAGAFVNSLIDATDDTDDPMSWIVDQMLNSMADSTFKDVLVAVKPFVIGYLNDKVTALAPNFVGTMKEVGMRLDDLMHHFGVEEILDVAVVDQTYVGKMTADGVHFTVSGTPTDILFSQNDIDDVVVPGVLVTLEAQTKLNIGEHVLPLPYGKILPVAMDTAIIPAIDPNATSLAGLMNNLVDCTSVGNNIASQVPLGNGAFWGSVCVAGLNEAAKQLYKQLADPSQILGLDLVGSARAADTNHDYKVDELTSGNWTGSSDYWGTPAALAQPATFTGKRI